MWWCNNKKDNRELASLDVSIHDMSNDELVKYLNDLDESCLICVKNGQYNALSVYSDIKLKVRTLLEDKIKTQFNNL
tara:strand:- start:539 stop:769 length:231 start_codon:yes stop_codon:yes gene_type:complete